jgi:hypothetical protein
VRPQQFDEIPGITAEKRGLRVAVEAELIFIYKHAIPIEIAPYVPGRVALDWAARYDSGDHGGALAVAGWYLHKLLSVDYSELKGDEPPLPVKGNSDISTSTHSIWGEVGEKDKGYRFYQNLGIRVERRASLRESAWWDSRHWGEPRMLFFVPYAKRPQILRKGGRPIIRTSKGWAAYWFVPNYSKGRVKPYSDSTSHL